MTLKNDRLLRVLYNKPVDVTPVWIMRQAGRYLPEYRSVRTKAGSFMELCKNPELATEVTMQPLERFPQLDAAILFSDILTIPDAMGQGLYFVSEGGPRFRKSISNLADVERLPVIEAKNDLSYVLETIKLTRRELNGSVPLIGFSGSPWTLAAYMVEGGSFTNLRKTKSLLYSNPEIIHKLLVRLTASIIDYLNKQIIAGIQIIQIFDTWGAELSHTAYPEFSLFYIKEVIRGLVRKQGKQDIPIIVFTKNAATQIERIASTEGIEGIGIDYTCDIGQVRARLKNKVALQGNMDPAVLHSNPTLIRNEVKQILSRYGKGSGHIFNLGHGITPEVDPKNVGVFIEAVHELSEKFH